MATVNRTKNNKYRVRWREGAQQREKGGFNTEQEAWSWYALNQETDPNSRRAQGITLGALRDAWWDHHVRNLALATAETYDANCRLRIDPFEHELIENIDRQWLNQWVRQIRSGSGVRAVNSTITTMSSIFQYAVEEGYVQHNPVHGLRRVAEEKRTATIPDLETVRLVARQSPTAWGTNAIMIAAFTGLRFSELFALDWNSVSDDRLIVRRALDRDLSFKETKTRKQRQVPILGEAGQWFAKQRRITQAGLVFQTSSGGPYARGNFRKQCFQPAMRGAQWVSASRGKQMESFRFHDLRHLFASLAISAGATAKEIQSWLGHSSIVTTFDVYGHLLESNLDDVRKRFDTLSKPVEANVIPLK